MSALERLAEALRDEGGLLAATVVARRRPRAAAARRRRRRRAATLPAARRGDPRGLPAALRRRAGRAPDDPDLALLAGDRLYALGLERLAALGDLDAVAELADVIALCAQAHAEGDPARAEAIWEAGADGRRAAVRALTTRPPSALARRGTSRTGERLGR